MLTEVKSTLVLCDKQVDLTGVELRDVRRLSDTGHLSSVISTNFMMSTALIALYLFSRLAQENVFRYMSLEYDIDRIIQYCVNELDKSIMVVNREYSNITKRLKKLR